MQPQVRYARTGDDVSIAYWVYGEGPLLVETPLVPFSHIEAEWQNPHIRRWYERLGQVATVVRYDGRGSGLSQRDVADVSLDAHVRDLDAVIQRLGSDPVALMGVFHSGPAAIAYAAAHPDRVSHLILWCTYASGSSYWKAAQSEGLRALRQTDYLLFLRTAAHELIGWADDDQSELYVDVMRRSVEPEQADRLIAATRDFEVGPTVRELEVPTLVLHRRDMHWLDIGLGRDLASRAPDGRLVVVDGQSPLPAAGDIDPVVRSIADFLGRDLSQHQAAGSAGEFRAVLFTDLVQHTAMMTALGDDRGRQVLREHEAMTRRVLGSYGGTEVKALGDGFMASFATVTRGVECAIALQRRIAEWNADRADDEPRLSVRIGLNAGEPIAEDGDLFGATVILASRIAAAAEGGEILVANAIRELSTGKKFTFSDRGDFSPKGMDGPVRIWGVDWQA